MDKLASIYLCQDRYREAGNLYLEVLAGRGMALGGECPETLKSVGNLALTYHYQGRLKLSRMRIGRQTGRTRRTRDEEIENWKD